MSAIGRNCAASPYLEYMYCGAIIHPNGKVDVVYTDDKGKETLSLKGFYTKGVDTMTGFGTPASPPKLAVMHTAAAVKAVAR